MWIEEYKTASGSKRYRYCDRYTDPLTGKAKKVSVSKPNKARATQKEAVEELNIKIDKLINRVNDEAELYEVIQEYIHASVGIKSESTIRNYESLFNIVKSIFPEGTRVMRISAGKWQEIADDMVKRYTTTSYARAFLNFVRRAIERAVRIEKLPERALKPLGRVVIQKKKRSQTSVVLAKNKFLTADELRIVLDAVEKVDKRLALLFEFQSLTGLRYGEMVALRRQDYNAEAHSININGSMSFKVSAVRGAPKNEFAYRNVLLDNRAEWILKHFLDNAIRSQLWMHDRRKRDDENLYIFAGITGAPLSIRYANRKLKQASALIRIDKNLSTHIFRHTHISLLAAQNVPLKAVMDRVGHEDPRTTLQVYTHVSDELRKQGLTASSEIAKKLRNA